MPLAGMPERSATIRAFRLGAFGVKIKCVLANDETTFLGNLHLPAFDLGIVEFLDASTVDAHQMIVMLPGTEFENRFARFEIVTFEQARLFELGENAVNGRQANVKVLGEQQPIDILCRQVADLGPLEQGENLEARKRGFQPDTLQIVGVTHRLPWSAADGVGLFFGYHIPSTALVISRGAYSIGLTVDPGTGGGYPQANTHSSLITYHDPTQT